MSVKYQKLILFKHQTNESRPLQGNYLGDAERYSKNATSSQDVSRTLENPPDQLSITSRIIKGTGSRSTTR